LTPVPEPTEAELAAVFKALDEGRKTRRTTVEDPEIGVPDPFRQPLGGNQTRPFE
jgi:hypothetical protein